MWYQDLKNQCIVVNYFNPILHHLPIQSRNADWVDEMVHIASCNMKSGDVVDLQW
jgi:hypothetical protein